jgi:hypothetical protein
VSENSSEATFFDKNLWIDYVCPENDGVDLDFYSDCVYYDVIQKNATSSLY